MTAIRWRWWWRRPRRPRWTPPTWCVVDYEELPAVVDLDDGDERQDAALSGSARQSLRRLAGPGARRAERTRRGRHHRQGAACGARERHQPAHGGGLDGNARRHRRLRSDERELHAVCLFAGRRFAARPGRRHHGRAEREAARDHRGRRRRLRHEDAGLSGISGAAGGGAQARPPGALAVDALGSLRHRHAGARHRDRKSSSRSTTRASS